MASILHTNLSIHVGSGSGEREEDQYTESLPQRFTMLNGLHMKEVVGLVISLVSASVPKGFYSS